MTKRWLHDWWVTLRYGSRFTKAGRNLRRNLRDPLSEYVEVEDWASTVNRQSLADVRRLRGDANCDIGETAYRDALAAAWDEGFSARVEEGRRQHEDPEYPIHRTNPYAGARVTRGAR